MVTLGGHLYQRAGGVVISYAVLGLLVGAAAVADEPPMATAGAVLPERDKLAPEEAAKSLNERDAARKTLLAERESAKKLAWSGKVVIGCGVGGGLLAIAIGMPLIFVRTGESTALSGLGLASAGGVLVFLGITVGVTLLQVGKSLVDKLNRGGAGALAPWLAPVLAGRTVDGAVGGIAVRF